MRVRETRRGRSCQLRVNIFCARTKNRARMARSRMSIPACGSGNNTLGNQGNLRSPKFFLPPGSQPPAALYHSGTSEIVRSPRHKFPTFDLFPLPVSSRKSHLKGSDQSSSSRYINCQHHRAWHPFPSFLHDHHPTPLAWSPILILILWTRPTMAQLLSQIVQLANVTTSPSTYLDSSSFASAWKSSQIADDLYAGTDFDGCVPLARSSFVPGIGAHPLTRRSCFPSSQTRLHTRLSLRYTPIALGVCLVSVFFRNTA